ncbi:mannitol dehydrogenase family protein [Pseudohoeflea suaedae]|uniref:Mannitol dehydrogenase family protein n=1 Tax=Pseudohoeflea suaedae TaxID=877384 RepID=A0A4R5PKV3_9HYPH|nr:mannitol dehydrogenase family protein [Pseudohoeflea suaedae]TDH36245.1 mannitol dehydrogenase family protein [Pseudohoeflea suaedae]
MSPRRLADISQIVGAAKKPGYDPSGHGTGIVHIGLGAFHRAHQAVMTDDALADAGGDWRITGVSLRSTEIADALNPQNGLYTLIERGPEGTEARVIAAIANVIAADPGGTLKALCDENIRIVTLTVTEKGYGIDRTAGGPDRNHPAVAEDLESPETPSGVLGLLVAALKHRRAARIAPFTVLSCDNLPENGKLLRLGVIGFARQLDADLADWIENNVAFPSSMVDRITPASTDETLAEAAAQTGCEDKAAVECEPFIQWVIEDAFPQGRPAWEAGGALFVTDVAPYERMKLTMLNGSHSMMAYAGFLAGHRYVRDVMNDPALARLVRRHLAAASGVMPPLVGITFADYGEALIERFRNPAIAHETYQIAMDGTQKLPQRIIAPALVALEQGRDVRPFAFATAAWMRYALGRKEDGTAYELRDPMAETIQKTVARLSDPADIYDGLTKLPGLFPSELAESRIFAAPVTDLLETMLDSGMRAAIDREAE